MSRCCRGRLLLPLLFFACLPVHRFHDRTGGGCGGLFRGGRCLFLFVRFFCRGRRRYGFRHRRGTLLRGLGSGRGNFLFHRLFGRLCGHCRSFGNGFGSHRLPGLCGFGRRFGRGSGLRFDRPSVRSYRNRRFGRRGLRDFGRCGRLLSFRRVWHALRLRPDILARYNRNVYSAAASCESEHEIDDGEQRQQRGQSGAEYGSEHAYGSAQHGHRKQLGIVIHKRQTSVGVGYGQAEQTRFRQDVHAPHGDHDHDQHDVDDAEKHRSGCGRLPRCGKAHERDEHEQGERSENGRVYYSESVELI